MCLHKICIIIRRKKIGANNTWTFSRSNQRNPHENRSLAPDWKRNHKTTFAETRNKDRAYRVMLGHTHGRPFRNFFPGHYSNMRRSITTHEGVHCRTSIGIVPRSREAPGLNAWVYLPSKQSPWVNVAWRSAILNRRGLFFYWQTHLRSCRPDYWGFLHKIWHRIFYMYGKSVVSDFDWVFSKK